MTGSEQTSIHEPLEGHRKKGEWWEYKNEEMLKVRKKMGDKKEKN
jgi:hypothetical protein